MGGRVCASMSTSEEEINAETDEFNTIDTSEETIINCEKAIVGVQNAIEGGLTYDQLLYQWNKIKDETDTMNKDELLKVLYKIGRNYPKLYNESINISFRNFANSDTEMQGNWFGIKNDLENRIKAPMVKVEASHNKIVENEFLEKVINQHVTSFFSAGKDTITLTSFQKCFNKNVGKKFLDRLLMQDPQTSKLRNGRYFNTVAKDIVRRLHLLVQENNPQASPRIQYK